MSQTPIRPVYVVLLLLAMLATACVPLPAATPEPAAASVEDASAKAGSAESASEESVPTITAITGNVTYRQRIALQPDAVIEVQLQDISRADAPAVALGKQTIEANGQQVPIPYVVEYDLSQINPANLYSLRATITEGGKLTWTSTSIIPVITRGAPTDLVDILVQQVGN